MNEKNKQYYNLQNFKNLIEAKTPTERDLEKFDEWKISKREELKKSCIGMLIIFPFVVVVGIGLSNLFGIILILFFCLWGFNMLKDFIKSKNWKLEYCDYGNIIDKYIDEDKRDNDYYVIVEVNNNNLKYKLKRKEFLKLDILDNVIVIAIENKKETFIVKN